MRKSENLCVGCETCTLGSACSLLHASVAVCDICGDDNAQFVIDDREMCFDCAYEYLNDAFAELDMDEKAKALGARFETIT